MKKTTLSLESHYWNPSHIGCPYALLCSCFEQADSAYYQTALLAYQQYAQTTLTYPNTAISTLIWDASVMQSLFRAAYQIYCNPKVYQQNLAQPPQLMAKPKLVYLSKKEGKNPYLVFQQLFRTFSLEQMSQAFFDLILATLDPDTKISSTRHNVSPIHYLLVIEAAEVLHKRISPVGLLN
ncbi:hypothetical protein [Myroides odoratus]|uniref:hypothetical protein n=1 Tax=Myroides odoratus TaxID=256 RepID=UPI0039B085B0